MANYMCILTVVCSCLLQGALGDTTIDDISGLVAAAVVGFFMFIVVVTMLVLAFTWDSWYPKIQRWRGKVKIPRHIIDLRKIRAQRETSDKAGLVSQTSKVPVTEQDSKSWVEGWNGEVKQYEEKDLTMDFGEEKAEEEEFRIEAELVDNEELDLGPYKKMPDQTIVASDSDIGMEEKEAPVYSTIFRESKKSQNGAVANNHIHTTPNHQYEETETSFSAMAADPAVVIM